MAVVTGELIRAMNYVEDMTTTLRRICIYIPNMSAEERKRLAESLRAAGASINAAIADLEKVFGPNNPVSGAVRVVAMDRMNAILVVTTQPKYLEYAANLIEKMDQFGGASTGGSRFYVYPVRNGKAEAWCIEARVDGDVRSGATCGDMAIGNLPCSLPCNKASVPPL